MTGEPRPELPPRHEPDSERIDGTVRHHGRSGAADPAVRPRRDRMVPRVGRPGAAPPRPARLRPADIGRLGAAGMRARPLRAALSALGVAIGIAAMLAVVGIATSSRAELTRQLDKLGTNLLRVAPGEGINGDRTRLPVETAATIARIGPVQAVAATATLEDIDVYRNDHIPSGQTGSIAVLAAQPALPATVGATLAAGSWLSPATERYPAVVLGAAAAERLEVRAMGTRVWLGGAWFAVVGVLHPVPLTEELDLAALVGWPAATRYLGFAGNPTAVYVRAAPDRVDAVRDVLGRTAKPQAPDEVRVSRPSDALAAREAADATLTGLLLGLGAVALLVGGVGVANTMVISVLERRAEVGLRRALGATRGQVRTQFLAESLLLAALGGAAGTLLGALVTAGYAASRGWPTVLPAWASAGGVAATVVVGGIAGLYPAVRASRMAPTEALSTP